MSLAEEMLDKMQSGNNSASYSSVDEGHIVINETRIAVVPNKLKTIAVTGDNDIETVTFDCVRFWDGNDLSTFAIYLNYVLPDLTPGTYIPEKITTSDGDEFYHFDWEIKKDITKKSGKIAFAITAVKTKLNDEGENVVDKQWGSLPNTDCSIALGLEISNVPSEEEESGIVEQLTAILEKIQVGVEESKSIFYEKNRIIHVGDNVLGDHSLGAGWSENSGVYTHSSNNTEDLSFSTNAEVGSIYFLDFDTSYSNGEFVSVGFGGVYKTLCYNGTSKIQVPLMCLSDTVLYITPISTFSGSISNIKLRKIQEDGTEIELNNYNVLTENHKDNYGFWNVLLGQNNAEKAVGTTRTIAIGNDALRELQGGNRNIGIGTYAMSQMKGGEGNISVGADSMLAVKEADSCVSIGKNAMHSGNNLLKNIAIGTNALYGSNESATIRDIAIGETAGYKRSGGGGNIMLGFQAGYQLQNGNQNIIIGSGTTCASTGSNNTIVGTNAGFADGVESSITIGHYAKATKSRQMVLGGTGITEVVLCSNKKLIFNSDGTVTWEAITLQ